jgi:murein L,D-transpeptidase YafK
MMRLLLFSIVLAGLGLVLCTPAMEPTPEETADRDPRGRVAAARQRCFAKVKERFVAAKVDYPPDELFLRAFKHEAVVEVWARSDEGPFEMIHSYPITASSGRPGPKRREGDGQVPEGFYVIDRFNAASRFHLSLGLNYPNASDRILSDPQKPGFDIYLHGGSDSAGCLPLGDAAIEELYLMAVDARNHARIPVHIFPARMAGPEWEKFLEPYRQRELAVVRFWEPLAAAYRAFETTHSVPAVSVARDGNYRVAPVK